MYFKILKFENLKKIKISNPSTKNIFYEVIMIGPNAENFSLPKGKEVPIGAKGKHDLHVEFMGNSLKPGNAYMLLVGRKKESMCADTLTFCMKATIDELTTKVI